MIVLPVLALTFAAAVVAPAAPRSPLPAGAPAHLGIALRLADLAGAEQLLADQQNPRSPQYRTWLTPAEFGERFGVSTDRYARISAWLAEAGFHVTPYPNRLYLEAEGTVASVRRLLGVQLRLASDGRHTFRTFDGKPTFPADLVGDLLHVSGLDTRVRMHHRLLVQSGNMRVEALGAADLRTEYDMTTLAGSTAAAGLTLVVLGTQEGTADSQGNPGAPFILPAAAAVNEYLSTISNATATYNPIVLPNTNADFDYPGSNQEYELDVEMQSVGAAGAATIDLLLPPASDVFMGGAQYIVNMLPDAVTVSTSLGLCESEEAADGDGPTVMGSEPMVMRQAVIQGLAEGQTWFAAAGDTGSDDCNDSSSSTNNGFDGGNATVDFPGSMPEIVDLGGTQFNGSESWSGAGALTAYVDETTWTEGANGGAAGGGQSMFYAKPSWQVGIGPYANDGVRDVPDISLAASDDLPGVATYECGAGQDLADCQGETTGAGSIDVLGGTSVASPLAAGIFALVAGHLGCHLGDIHPALYQLGTAQQHGGPTVFHDITSGNNSFPDPQNHTIAGFAAGTGYDLATGWGTLDVAALAANWPGCPVSTASSSSSSSGTVATSNSGTSNSATSSSGTTSSTSATSSTSSSGTAGTSGSIGSSGTATSSSTAASTGSTTGTTTGGTLHLSTTGSTGASSTGGRTNGGCGCSSPSDGPDSLFALMTASMVGLAKRSRRRSI